MRAIIPPAVLYAVLLFAVSCGAGEATRPVLGVPRGRSPARDAAGSNGPPLLWVPAINLHAALQPTVATDGRVDRAALKTRPALVLCREEPALRRMRRPGLSLILGHRQWRWRPLVFARLDELRPGDPVVIYDEHLALHYRVRGTVEIDPADVWETLDKLDRTSCREERPMVALLTCAPYGYNRRRLLVHAGLEAEILDAGRRGDPCAQ